MRTSRRRHSGGTELRPLRPVPAEGEIRLRVRYAECDPMNVAHHGAFVAWLEMARTELLRTCGITYADLEQAGIFLVVTRIELAYKAPARYDDMIVIAVRVTGGGRARINHEYEVWHDAEDGRGKSTLLVTASSTLGCVDSDGHPQPLPEWLTPGAHVAESH